MPLYLISSFSAVHDEKAAVLVGVPDVPGVQPAILVEHGRGGVGPIQVALHHLRSADADLSLLPRSELRPGHDVDHFGLGVRHGWPDPRRLGRLGVEARGVRDR